MENGFGARTVFEAPIVEIDAAVSFVIKFNPFACATFWIAD